MVNAKRGDLVQIHRVILESEQRANNLPSSTKAVPYECWIKGFLLDESAHLGDEVKIKTFIGRELSGTLHQVNPVYDHHFGTPQNELLTIGDEARELLTRTQETMRRKSNG